MSLHAGETRLRCQSSPSDSTHACCLGRGESPRKDAAGVLGTSLPTAWWVVRKWLGSFVGSRLAARWPCRGQLMLDASRVREIKIGVGRKRQRKTRTTRKTGKTPGGCSSPSRLVLSLPLGAVEKDLCSPSPPAPYTANRARDCWATFDTAHYALDTLPRCTVSPGQSGKRWDAPFRGLVRAGGVHSELTRWCPFSMHGADGWMDGLMDERMLVVSTVACSATRRGPERRRKLTGWWVSLSLPRAPTRPYIGAVSLVHCPSSPPDYA